MHYKGMSIHTALIIITIIIILLLKQDTGEYTNRKHATTYSNIVTIIIITNYTYSNSTLVMRAGAPLPRWLWQWI